MDLIRVIICLRNREHCTFIPRWIKSFAVFWYPLVCSTYITWPKMFKPWKAPSVIGSIVVVGALTRCALRLPACDLKAVQMNVKRSLCWELTLHEFEPGRNAAEATKNICWIKGESAVVHCMVSGKAKNRGLQGRAPSHGGKSDESIRRPQHLTVQFNSSSSRLWQKHPKLLDVTKILQSFWLVFTFFTQLFKRFFFLHTVVWYQVFQSNTNNLNMVVWFQVCLSNNNNLYTILWFPVTISI